MQFTKYQKDKRLGLLIKAKTLDEGHAQGCVSMYQCVTLHKLN